MKKDKGEKLFVSTMNTLGFIRYQDLLVDSSIEMESPYQFMRPMSAVSTTVEYQIAKK